jgi:hypothetical protein
MAKRLSDHFGHRNTVCFGAACEPFFEFGVETDGLDGRRRGAESRSASLASAAHDLVDVVAVLGLACELLDEFVVDGAAGLGVSVGSLGHGSRSFR